METYGYLSFKDQEVKDTFLSLNKKEVQRFEKDLEQLLEKVKHRMIDVNIFETHLLATQRIDKRHFIVKLLIDLTPTQMPLVVLDEFTEVGVDEYLDNMSEQKALGGKEYLKCTVN